MQCICYFINKIPTFNKKTLNVQNINSILTRYIKKSWCDGFDRITCCRGPDGHCIRSFFKIKIHIVIQAFSTSYPLVVPQTIHDEGFARTVAELYA